MPRKQLPLEKLRSVLYMNRGEYAKLALKVGVSGAYVSMIMNGWEPRSIENSKAARAVLAAAQERAAELIAEKKTGRSDTAA